MKKYMGMALAAAVALTTTGSCYADSSDIGLKMAWWGNQVRNERTQNALDLFTEQTGIGTEGQFYQWGDYWGKMATDAAGNSLADVIQMDYSYIKNYTDSGLLLDLTPYIEDGTLDVSNISESVLQLGEVDGGIYGIAAGVNSPGMFYNKTLLDEAGIELHDYMTIDEFVEIAKEVTEKTGYRANLISDGKYYTLWARGEGIAIKAAKMGAEDADAYTGYFGLLADGLAEGWHLSYDIANANSGAEDNSLVYGSSPEMMSWCSVDGSNWLVPLQSAAAEGVEIAITTEPTADPTASNYLKPSMYFSVSANTAHPEEAVSLLNFLINSVEANEILMGERGVFVSSAVAEALYDQLDDVSQKAMDYVSNIVTSNCSPIDPPDPIGWSEVSALLIELEEAVGYGEITPEEASEEFFSGGNQIFAQNNQ